MALTKADRRQRIKYRIRKRLSGSGDRPRMTVFRSNKQIYVQLVDDLTGKTLGAASSKEKEIASQKVNKIDQSKLVGKRIAEVAKEKGIETVVFDRNGYLYHGRVKNLADAARKSGLKL
jgi:large subunit ribosomal protein L18